jgi:hypothetical protein
MAKGQMRQSKEKKKPKSEKDKVKHVSSYKAQFGSGSSTSNTPMHNMGAPKKG